MSRAKTIVGSVLALLVLAAAATLPLSPAADAATATISLSPTQAEVGDWVTVHGEGFPARERGDVMISGQHVASFRPDSAGIFTIRFRVPELSPGHHTVLARSTVSAEATLTAGTPPPPDDDGETDPGNGGGTDPGETVTTNFFAGATFFTDPDSNAAIEAANDPANAHIWNRIGNNAQADWFGDWNQNVERDARARATLIREAGALPVFVAYAIPSRDCGQYSAGGANSPDGYRAWIQAFADGINGHDVVVILEPDALAHLDCLDSEKRATRVQLLGEAVDTLNAAGASVYLDAGNSRWIDVPTMAERLAAAGVNNARGFSLNVSNFNWTDEEIEYGRRISSLIGDKPFVVDTSRNGLGPSTDPRDNETWCNPPGRALGTPTTAGTGSDLVDALVWIKRPGESDGTCKGGPNAGAWYPEYAFGLAERAPWASDGSDDDTGAVDRRVDVAHSFTGGRHSDKHLAVAVTVADGASAAPGVDVTVRMEPEDQTSRTFTGTTGSDGGVVFSWNNAPLGDLAVRIVSVDGVAWDGDPYVASR